MAIESYYLRKKIKLHLTTLEKYTKLTEIPHDSNDRIEEYFSAVEIKVIEICSLMRKMDDLGKLPDKTLTGRFIDVKTFKSKDPDSQRAYVDMEKEYDLEKPQKTKLSLRVVCNIVMHSYILQAMGDKDNEFKYIFVTSDYTQFEGLYMIELPVFIIGFRGVVDLYPSQIRSYYDKKKQLWVHRRS